MTSNGAAAYVYDAENRLIATAGYSYIYDGDGQRVEKCTEGTPGTCATSGATGTLYWRGFASDPLSETNLAGTFQNAYVFFNGQRVARIDSAVAVHYYFSDHLGSHGVVENATGTTCEQDIDYYPYGGVENDYCPNASQNYKFTSKERDSESGLDNFGARYNASTMGRFMTLDPVHIMKQKLIDPQQWNMYAYVRNNPLRFTDPTGMYLCKGDKTQCGVVHTALDLAKTAAGKLPQGSKEWKALEKSIAAYGKEGVANGVVVKFGDLKGTMESGTSTTADRKTTTVTFDLNQMAKDFAHAPSPADEVTGTVAHEGAIAGDQRANGEPTSKADVVREETAGATAEAGVHEGLGSREQSWGLWDPAWKPAEARGKMDQGIKREVNAGVDEVCRNSDICD
jgi:RHS repeat-associated protein